MTGNYFAEWPGNPRGLAFLLLLSLALKGAIVFAAGIVNVDGIVYITAAQKFVEGDFRGGLAIYPMPFFPILIAAFHFIVPDWVLAGQLISFMALVFTVIPLYYITEKIFDRNAAFWAGLAFCLAPMINGYAADIYRDPIFLFFFAWSVYFALCALIGKKIIYFFLFSISFMFAFLCRIEAVSLPAAFLLCVFLFAIRNKEKRAFLFTGATIFLGVVAILIGLLWLKMGPDLLSVNRINEVSRFAGVFNLSKYQLIYSQLSELEKTIPGWGELAHNFVEITRHYLWLIYLVGLLEIVVKLLFPVFVIPLYLGFHRVKPNGQGHLFLLLLFGLYLLGCYHFHIQHNFMEKRYLLPPTCLLFPWVGAGLAFLLRQTARFRWRKIGISCFLLLFMVIPLIECVEQVEAKDDTVKIAGTWLASRPDWQQATIISSGSRVAFYAGRGHDFLHVTTSWEQIGKVANKRKPDLLIIEASSKNKKSIPGFKRFELLQEFAGEKDVVLIFRRKS